MCMAQLVNSPFKKIAVVLMALSIVFNFSVRGQTPNYVKTTVHNVNGSSDVESISYSDGLGRAIQSQVKLNEYSGKVLVSGTYYDEVGRAKESVLPFTEPQAALGFISGDMKTKANAFYNGTAQRPNAGNYAFSDVEYYNDPLGRVKSSGAPGEYYALKYDNTATPNANGHPVQTWYLGVALEDYTITSGTNSITIENGFIDWNNLDEGVSSAVTVIDRLDAIVESQAYKTPAGVGALTHFLTITRGPNPGVYTQQITDIFGKVVKTWAHGTDNTNNAVQEMIAEYDFDILGNPLTETPPGGGALIDNSTYTYNTLGQVVTKTTPDAGTVSYEYDDAGRLIKSVNALQAVSNQSVRYTYDKLGRLTKTELYDESATRSLGVRNRKMYDDIADVKTLLFEIPDLYFSFINKSNLRGRLVADIYYNVEKPDEISEKTRVVDLFSYDDEGRVNFKIKKIPGYPLQLFSYGYDIHGKITHEYYNNLTFVSHKVYTYNSDGQLEGVSRAIERSRFLGVTVPSGKIIQYRTSSHRWLENQSTINNGSPISLSNQTYANGIGGEGAQAVGEYSWILYHFTGVNAGITFTDNFPFALNGYGGAVDNSENLDMTIRVSRNNTEPSHSDWINEAAGVEEVWSLSEDGNKVNIFFQHAETNPVRWMWFGIKTLTTGENHGAWGDIRLNVTTEQQKLMEYSYNELGQLSSKSHTLNAPGEEDIVNNKYNVRGWLTMIKSYKKDGWVNFVELLAYNEGDSLFNIYNSAAHPQYNGNLAMSRTYWSSLPGSSMNYSTGDYYYKYDAANRLLVSDNQLSHDTLDEAFAYDAAGRITKKRDGSTDVSSAYNRKYKYDAVNKNSRLQCIENHPTKDNANNFVYDLNGNMVLDRSKNMVIDYDWRDMPIRFRFYNAIPSQSLTYIDVANNALASRAQTQLVSTVEMWYDAGGNRVTKTEYNHSN